MVRTFAKRVMFGLVSTLALMAVCLQIPMKAAAAAAVNTAPQAKISFTFDDGFLSTITKAAPTLAKYGMTGTAYVTTDCIGMTTVPNTCRASKTTPYLTWQQVQQLQNQWGWEIGSHTATHPLLASTDPIDQPQRLTSDQVITELTKSKNALTANGINARSFASPYGDYDMPALSEIAKLYNSQRGFWDTGYNTWPNNEYLIRVQQVQIGVSYTTVKSYIDTAIANKTWLVLVFHDVVDRTTRNTDSYAYVNSQLDRIASYAKSKKVQSVNVSDAFVNGDNLLPNGSFDAGINQGWTTDAPANITATSGNNGSHPSPVNAVQMTSGATPVHLYSPILNVNPNATYVLKNYAYVRSLTSGELSFYVDEYDALGNWISGQYKGGIRSVFAMNFNFSYKPTSASVAKARIQLGLSANSGINAYVDNMQWIQVSSTGTPPPAPTNMIVNGTFDAGMSGGWTTDNPTLITADSSNNGSPANPINSVKLTSGATTGHLFGPAVTVDPAKTYSIASFLRIQQISGNSIGFYIDEYDASGNWVSGQYKATAWSTGASDISFQYKPTSATVKSSKMQVIVNGGATILAYIDDIRWYAL